MALELKKIINSYKIMNKNYRLFMLFFLFISCTPIQKLDDLISDFIMKGRAANEKYNEKLTESDRCPPGMYMTDCGSGCGPTTCENYFNLPELCPAVCRNYCVCIDGIWDKTIGQCVGIEDCYNYLDHATDKRHDKNE